MVNAGSKGAFKYFTNDFLLRQQNVDGKRIPYGFEDRALPILLNLMILLEHEDLLKAHLLGVTTRRIILSCNGWSCRSY